MAVHTTINEDGNNSGETTPTNSGIHINIGSTLDNEVRDAIDNATPYLTLGSKNITTMATGLGSEYLTKLKEELETMYAKEEAAISYKINVFALDKEVKTNLAYSCIVVAMSKNNNVVYHILMVEATGRKPLTATAIMNELNNTRMQPHQRLSDLIYVTSDAIDITLRNNIVDHLRGTYKGNFEFYAADALVIPWYNTDLSTANVRPIGAVAFNSCFIESGKINAEFNDLNLAASKRADPKSMLKIETNVTPTTHKDAAGKLFRSDWQIELAHIDNSGVTASLNLQNNKTVVCTTSGFIDAMPVESSIPQGPMMAPINVIRLRPVINITHINLAMYTTGYSLLAIAATTVMLRPSMWLGAVVPKANDKLHDYGRLNLITNNEGNQDGTGELIDLRSPDLDPNAVQDILKKMFSLDPMYSMDVEIYGATTNYTSVFSLASAPGNNPEEADAKYAAAQEIIDAAITLTDGHFPEDFNPNKIFLDSGIVVPTGTWTDKDGNSRDIRDIDMAFIATTNPSVALLNKWALSNVPHSVSGIDPYISKIEIITKLNINAEISGKAVRVVFDPAFIIELTRACAAAGFDPRYDPIVSYSEQTNLAVLGNYLQNAGVSQNVADFARPFTNNAMVYQTPFASGGYRH